MKRIILLTTLLLSVLIFMNSCEKKIIDPFAPIDGVVTVTEDITENMTWEAGNIYVIDGTLNINGVTLTIEPGTVVKFKAGAEIKIGQSTQGSVLIANGTDEKPILFTSFATSPDKGDWNGLYFYDGTASSTSMKYCIVEYAGNYSSYGSINMASCEITIENSIIRASKTWGITLNSSASFKSFINNNINNTDNHVISIYPNAVHTIGINNDLVPISNNLGININGGTFNQTNETWLAQTASYIVSGTIQIGKDAGSILHIQEGSNLSFTTGAELKVGQGTYGSLIAKGTNEKPINFTSSSISPDNGDWLGIYIYDSANNCEFEFCNFEYGGGYSPYGMINISSTKVSFNNCSFKNSATWGISLSGGSFSEFSNNTFMDNSDYQISIDANYVHTIGTGNTFGSQLGVFVNGGSISKQGIATWPKLDVPYYIQGTVHVGSTSGTTLNIQAGTTLKFINNAELKIGQGSAGKITANGTVAQPIIFTSANLSPAQGDWLGIYLYDDTMNNTKFDHCVFSYGGGYSPYGMINITGCGNEVSISNSSIKDSKTWGISKDSSTAIPSLTNIYYNNNLNGNKNW